VVRRARREKSRPTLVICTSHIGLGSPNKVDTASSHGEPLGEDEVLASKRHLGLPEDQPFHVPERVREVFAARARTMKRRARKWQREFDRYAQTHPELASAWNDAQQNVLPADLEACLPDFDLEKPIATRSASGKVIQALAAAVPSLVGGAADLAPSTKTLMDNAAHIGPGAFDGRNFHFGVREHAMAAMMNGMALHGGFRVFGATFFVFVDYCRPSVRLAALMNLPVIYVFTHDSIFVGEDGPTHQPIEQLCMLRAAPGVTTIRPADATETAAAWIAALRNTDGPTALMLTRHNLPVIDRAQYPSADGVHRGAYTLWQSVEGDPEVILIATGSEVPTALDAARDLAGSLIVRVVSMPSWELFEAQPAGYRDDVLPPTCRKRVAIEAGVGFGWERYVGESGRTIGIDRYGASGPYPILAEQFGFTPDNIVAVVREMMSS